MANEFKGINEQIANQATKDKPKQQAVGNILAEVQRKEGSRRTLEVATGARGKGIDTPTFRRDLDAIGITTPGVAAMSAEANKVTTYINNPTDVTASRDVYGTDVDKLLAAHPALQAFYDAQPDKADFQQGLLSDRNFVLAVNERLQKIREDITLSDVVALKDKRKDDLIKQRYTDRGLAYNGGDMVPSPLDSTKMVNRDTAMWEEAGMRIEGEWKKQLENVIPDTLVTEIAKREEAVNNLLDPTHADFAKMNEEKRDVQREMTAADTAAANATTEAERIVAETRKADLLKGQKVLEQRWAGKQGKDQRQKDWDTFASKGIVELLKSSGLTAAEQTAILNDPALLKQAESQLGVSLMVKRLYDGKMRESDLVAMVTNDSAKWMGDTYEARVDQLTSWFAKNDQLRSLLKDQKGTGISEGKFMDMINVLPGPKKLKLLAALLGIVALPAGVGALALGGLVGAGGAGAVIGGTLGAIGDVKLGIDNASSA